MLKEKIRETEHSLSERQCKWRNIYFSKHGRSHLGNKLFDTKEEAVAGVVRSLERAKLLAANNSSKDCMMTGFGDNFRGSEYAWSMQIPVLQS